MADLKAGTRIAGRYEVHSVVGSGPFGTVYRATDLEIEVAMALKIVGEPVVASPSERHRLAEAMRLARRVTHANLNRVFDAGEDGSLVYIASQLVDGLSLERAASMRRDKGEAFTMDEWLPMVSQIAAALAAAHRTTFHGDLKPSNVVLLPDVLKVTDLFLYEGIERKRFATWAGRFVAPEIALAQGDSRSDIFSLGAIVFELAARIQFVLANWEDLAPPSLDPKVVQVLKKALALSPSDRHATVDEFRVDLLRACGAADTSAVAPSAAPLVTGEPTEIELSDVSTDPDSLSLPPPLPRVGKPTPIARRPEEGAATPTPQRPAPKLQTPTPTVGESVAVARAAPSHRLGVRWVVLMIAFVAGTVGPIVALTRLDSMIAEVRALPVPDGPTSARPVPPTQRIEPTSPVDQPPQRPGSVTPPAVREDAGETATRVEPQRPSAAADAGGAPASADRERRERAIADATPARGRDGDARIDMPRGKGKCPRGMILVKAGKTKVGSASTDSMRSFGDRALATVTVDDFCIDTFEFPNRRGSTPVTQVNFHQASALCAQQGKRLCAEDEWEKACSGARGNRYPYGDDFDADRCNSADGSNAARAVQTTGEFGKCRSRYGVADMSGNVAEWTAAGVDPNATAGAVRGGSSSRPDYSVRCASRLKRQPGDRAAEIGLRCCKTP